MYRILKTYCCRWSHNFELGGCDDPKSVTGDADAERVSVRECLILYNYYYGQIVRQARNPRRRTLLKYCSHSLLFSVDLPSRRKLPTPETFNNVSFSSPIFSKKIVFHFPFSGCDPKVALLSTAVLLEKL